jgi:hypothetical protein
MMKVTARIGPAVRHALAGDIQAVRHHTATALAVDAQVGVPVARDGRCPVIVRVGGA